MGPGALGVGQCAVTREPTIAPARRAPPVKGPRPNDLWCTDFKGKFKLGNRQILLPLTFSAGRTGLGIKEVEGGFGSSASSTTIWPIDLE